MIDPEEQILLKKMFEDFTGTVVHGSEIILSNDEYSLIGICEFVLK